MTKTKKVYAILFTLLLLNACSSISEGLGGSKKVGSDEFLVEKKAPLILPPSFEELPKPTLKKEENGISIEEESSQIKEIINQNSSTDITKEKDDFTNSIEESIIKKINKKKIKVIAVDGTLENTKEEKIETFKKESFFQKLKKRLSKKQ